MPIVITKAAFGTGAGGLGPRPILVGTTRFHGQAPLARTTEYVQIPLRDLQIIGALLVIAILLLIAIALHSGSRKNKTRGP